MCVWEARKIINYFTIQFIFVTIYGHYYTIHSLTILFQLTFTFIYNTFSKNIFNFMDSFVFCIFVGYVVLGNIDEAAHPPKPIKPNSLLEYRQKRRGHFGDSDTINYSLKP